MTAKGDSLPKITLLSLYTFSSLLLLTLSLPSLSWKDNALVYISHSIDITKGVMSSNYWVYQKL